MVEVVPRSGSMMAGLRHYICVDENGIVSIHVNESENRDFLGETFPVSVCVNGRCFVQVRRLQMSSSKGEFTQALFFSRALTGVMVSALPFVEGCGSQDKSHQSVRRSSRGTGTACETRSKQ